MDNQPSSYERSFPLAVVYVGACLMWTALVVLPLLVWAFGGDFTSPLALSASAVGMSGSAVGIGWAMRRARRWSPKETWAVRRPALATLGWGSALLATLSLGTVGEALGTKLWDLLSDKLGLELPTDALATIAEALTMGATSHRVVLSVVIVLIGPILEELVFRGFLWRLFRGEERPWAALVGTSLLFALWHLDPIQSVGVLPLAIFLGVLRWRSRSLIPCVAVHVLNNGFALVSVIWGTGEPTSLPWLIGACVMGASAFAVISHRSAIS